MGRSRPSLGARGGEPRESNPPRGILPYVPFPGILPFWGFASLFPFGN